MTGNQDPSFERIHPDDAVGCAAVEAACRRWHNLTLILLGTLADSGRTSFADDRRLFMAWQVTRLLAPSWNEPPAWFVQRHIENKRDIERKGVQAEGGRGGLWYHRRSTVIRWGARIICRLSGWSPGHPAGDVLVTSGDHVHDKHCLGWALDPRRVLEAA